jgi:predicted metal-binding membrane protein
LLQQWLEHMAWLSPMAMRSVPWLGGLLLIMAGVYQWLPAMQTCLVNCQAPFSFLLRYPVRTWRDTWHLGMAHGGYCLGCCWALMCVLFAVGIMNLLWIAALTGFVMLEKTVPGPWFRRAAGGVLMVWGAAVWLQAV